MKAADAGPFLSNGRPAKEIKTIVFQLKDIGGA